MTERSDNALGEHGFGDAEKAAGAATSDGRGSGVQMLSNVEGETLAENSHAGFFKRWHETG